METPKIKSVEEERQEFIKRFAGKLFDLAGYRAERAPATYLEVVLTQDRASLHTSLVAAVEKLPPNPDNDHEADIYRKGYNRAADHFLTIINSIFEE